MEQKKIKFKDKEKWTTVIDSNKSIRFDLTQELFKYKDLIFLFIKRDFTTYYKQTILGPIWYILQPLLNTIVFTIIFGNFAKIPLMKYRLFYFILLDRLFVVIFHHALIHREILSILTRKYLKKYIFLE